MHDARKPRYAAWRNLLFLLTELRKNYRLLLFFLVLEMTAGSVLPFFGLYLPKLAVDLVAERASTVTAVAMLGGVTLAYIVVKTAHDIAVNAKYWEQHDMRYSAFMVRVFLTTLTCDYERLECESGQTLYQKAFNQLICGDWSPINRMLTAATSIVTGLAGFALYAAVIAYLNPLVLLLLAGISGVNYFALRYAREYENRHRDESAVLTKKLNYLASAATDVQAGKDTRLFGMSNWLLTLRDRVVGAYKKLSTQIQNRHYAAALTDLLTLLLRDGAAYVYLIYSVASGQIGVGDFVLYFGAVTGFSGWVSRLVNDINQMGSANQPFNELRAYMTYARESDNPAAGLVPDVSVPPTVVFTDVCFAYEKGGANVLEHFNLTIHAGEKLALVGVNGAGKTTIVKLLCGFYRPDSGTITINGVDINHIARNELYRLFSAVFQDIAIFPFSVAENVSLRPAGDTDYANVERCLREAGLWEAVRTLRHGTETPVLREISEEGAVFSGGQQQKLLMARALYKDAPMLVLDEPTAALDPIAESEVYERFHTLSGHKTALYISHRLASTRFCDRVAFLENGRVTELGSHDALMTRDGAYAHMYAVQSHYYTHHTESEAAL